MFDRYDGQAVALKIKADSMISGDDTRALRRLDRGPAARPTLGVTAIWPVSCSRSVLWSASGV